MSREYLLVVLLVCAVIGFAESVARPDLTNGSITGTVVDVNDGVVPGATVVLECSARAHASDMVNLGALAERVASIPVS